MLQRILTAALGVPVVFAAVYFGGLWIALAIGLAALCALYEYLLLTGFDRRTALISAAALTIPCYFNILLGLVSWETYIMAYIMVVTSFGMVLARQIWGVERTLALGLGGLYIPLLLAGLVLIRSMENGFVLTLLVLALTWGTDTGAYFAGMLWGNKKLAPSISPNKTWAGAWGGFISGIVIGVGGALIINADPLVFAAWGAIGSVLCQIGDLTESAVKRWAGVKDSGNCLPGHGGVYDRVDSLLFTAAVSYIFFGMVL